MAFIDGTGCACESLYHAISTQEGAHGRAVDRETFFLHFVRRSTDSKAIGTVSVPLVIESDIQQLLHTIAVGGFPREGIVCFDHRRETNRNP